MAKIEGSLNKAFYIPPMALNRPKVQKPLYYKSRRGATTKNEKNIIGGLSNNIENAIEKYFSDTDLYINGIKPMIFQTVKSLTRANQVTYDRLKSQAWITDEELTLINENIPFTPLALSAKLARSFLDCHAQEISQFNISVLLKRFILLGDISKAMKENDLSFSDVMHFIRKNSDTDNAIKRLVSTGKQLVDKYGVSMADAKWFVKAYTYSDEATNNAGIQAKQLEQGYGISHTDAMYFVKGYKDSDTKVKNAVALAYKLAKKYGISVYIAMYYVKEYTYPKEAIKRSVAMAKKLSEKFGICFNDSMYFIKEYKDAEGAIKRAIAMAKQLSEKYGISLSDSMEFVKTYKDPESSLRTILDRKAAIELLLPRRKDLPKTAYNTIINSAVFKENYLEVARSMSQKLDEVLNEVSEMQIPLPDAIAQLSLLNGMLPGKLLIQAFGGFSKINKSCINGDQFIGLSTQYNDRVKYKHIDYSTPLSTMLQREEQEIMEAKVNKIRDILMSALSAEENINRRCIQSEILSQLLSESFKPNELTQKFGVSHEEIIQNTNGLFSAIKSSSKINEELSALGVLRGGSFNKRLFMPAEG